MIPREVVMEAPLSQLETQSQIGQDIQRAGNGDSTN